MSEKPIINVNLDLKPLARPVEKLIETIGGGIAGLYKPVGIKRVAKAEAEAQVIKTEGDIKAQELLDRAKARLETSELRKQRNIESIVGKAIAALPEEVSETPVDEDWANRFISYAGDVGSEEVQLLWAKVLAREVARPGTYSLRALEALRVISRQEAELFSTAANYFWEVKGDLIIPHTDLSDEYLKEKGLGSRSLQELDAAGLVRADLIMDFASGKTFELLYGDLTLTVASDKRASVIFTNLTSVGEELYSLCEPSHDIEYVKRVKDGFRAMGIILREDKR